MWNWVLDLAGTRKFGFLPNHKVTCCAGHPLHQILHLLSRYYFRLPPRSYQPLKILQILLSLA